MSSATAPVAAVLMTKDRAADAVRAAGRLLALPERPEVVVVDNASSDGTPRRLRDAFPDLRVIALPRNLGAAARNLAVRELDAPYVAFCDDDTSWEPGALERAAQLLDAHPRLALVCAHILVGDGERDDPVCADMAESPLPAPDGIPGRPLLSFLAGASVVRRRAFLEAGGFEPRLLIGGEEELLAADLASAGWHMSYVPELRVRHYASQARDPHGRRALGIRNALWFTWLRRPAPSALRRTAMMLRRVPRDRVTARALAAALRGLPWVLRERRVVPDHVERRLALLDRPQMSSRARRYVS